MGRLGDGRWKSLLITLLREMSETDHQMKVRGVEDHSGLSIQKKV